MFFLSLTYPSLLSIIWSEDTSICTVLVLCSADSICIIVIMAVCDTQHRMRVGRSGVPSWKGRAILLFSQSLRQALWLVHSSTQSVPLFFPGGKAAGTWSQPLISSSPSDHSGNVTVFWCRTKRGCVTAHSVTWHRLYQGVLCFQNVIRFHRIPVILITFCPQ